MHEIEVYNPFFINFQKLAMLDDSSNFTSYLFLKIAKKKNEKLDSFHSSSSKYDKKKNNLSEYQVNKYSKILSQDSAKSLQKMKIKDSSISDSSNSNFGTILNKNDSIDFSTIKSADIELIKKDMFNEAQDLLKQEKALAEFKKNLDLQEKKLNSMRDRIQNQTNELTEEENFLIKKKREISQQLLRDEEFDEEILDKKKLLLKELERKKSILNCLELESKSLENTLNRELQEYEVLKKIGKKYSDENFKFKVTFIETLEEYDDGFICFAGDQNNNADLKERKKQLEIMLLNSNYYNPKESSSSKNSSLETPRKSDEFIYETPDLNFKFGFETQNARTSEKHLNLSNGFDNMIAQSLDFKNESSLNRKLLGMGALALKNAKLKLSKSSNKELKETIDKNLIAKKLSKFPKNSSEKLFDNYFGN